MSQVIKFFFSIITSCMILVSCAKKTIGESIERVERRKTSELMDVLDSLSVLKPNTFYSKISTKYADTSQNISFKTSIRLISDSAINALITYATLPIYNSILTSDSLKISNKRAKCFTKTKLNFIKENFGISFDYKNVEELILGMPIAYDASQKYFQIYDPYQYIISSHRKREIKKSDKKEKYQDDVIIKYFISNDLKNLKKIEVESKADTARVELFFLEREFISNINIPSRILIKIRTKRNEININMNYEKTEINFPQKLFFVIPEGYKECGD